MFLTLRIIGSIPFILFIGLVLAYNYRLLFIYSFGSKPFHESYIFLVIPSLSAFVSTILPRPYGSYLWIPIAVDPASYLLIAGLARVAWIGIRGSKHEK